MSALPEPTSESGRKTAAQRVWVEALQGSARERGYRAEHERQRERDRRVADELVSLTWETPCGSEAEMQVFVDSEAEQILDAILCRLDFRTPTVGEASQVEEAFRDALEEQDTLREQLMSRVWERRT